VQGPQVVEDLVGQEEGLEVPVRKDLAVLAQTGQEAVDRKVRLVANVRMVVLAVPVDQVGLVQMVLDFLLENDRTMQEFEDSQNYHHHKTDYLDLVV
jgi:hypothetical protein